MKLIDQINNVVIRVLESCGIDPQMEIPGENAAADAGPAINSGGQPYPTSFSEALARERAGLIYKDGSPRVTTQEAKDAQNAKALKDVADFSGHNADLVEFLSRAAMLSEVNLKIAQDSGSLDAYIAWLHHGDAHVVGN